MCFAVKVKQQPIDVRISTLPNQFGESVVMRLLNQGGGALTLERLGMPPAMLEKFRAIVHRPNGLVRRPAGVVERGMYARVLQEPGRSCRLRRRR